MENLNNSAAAVAAGEKASCCEEEEAIPPLEAFSAHSSHEHEVSHEFNFGLEHETF